MAAQIILPRLGVSGLVSFLLDTGADQTVLMPADALRLNLDHAQLRGSVQSVGVGGPSQDFLETGVIVVTDGVLHAYSINVIVSQPRQELMGVPSLIGRNIMNRWRVVFDYTSKTVTAEILSSDFQAPIPAAH